MLEYLRFSTQNMENRTVIEIRVSEGNRLDAVIEGVSYPFFECAYSLTAEHGEEWLERIDELHMEQWKKVYMASEMVLASGAENWEIIYREEGGKDRKLVGRGGYPENWNEFLKIMDEIIPTAVPGQVNKVTLEYQRMVPLQNEESEASEEQKVLWDYKEELILDRYAETLTIKQIIESGRETKKEYYMKGEIPELIDRCMACLGRIEGQPYPALEQGPMFKLRIETGGSADQVLSGRYNRCGLPVGWEDFVKEIYKYVRFYESYEDILNPYIYKRGRRQGEYIICSVSFHEGGKQYYYWTEDESLEIGNEVVVPAGAYNQEIPAKIEDINYYTKDKLPMSLEKMKRILKKI